MTRLTNDFIGSRPKRPIKVVQFGGGNFLRAFVDSALQVLNDEGIYETDVAVVQPLRATSQKPDFEAQDGLYTLIQEGLQQGEFVSKTQLIDVLQKSIDPYEDYEAYLALAALPTLEFIFSNTTESGIVLDESDTMDHQPPHTFPGKLLAFLHHRYHVFSGAMDKGLTIIPCELIDDNGDTLHRHVKRLAEIHDLGADFMHWLAEANTFTNTLVDRIVPGYPADTRDAWEKKLGYQDHQLVMAEVFHLWVIEDRGTIRNRLDGQKAGLNIHYVKDIKPYKIQKVRILNGLHTLMVPIAYLKGLDTVGEAMKDVTMLRFIKQVTDLEMIPATKQHVAQESLQAFANEVYDRFSNPQIQHSLLSIALNATAKFKSRVLPTVLDYVQLKGECPAAIAFSLGSLLVFFKGDRHGEVIHLQDEPLLLTFYQELWGGYEAGELTVSEMVTAFLRLTYWETDLNEVPGLTDHVKKTVEAILSKGMTAALSAFLTVSG
ncbi:MAG: tagaturonate reductase [Defluviitaleaceae bacterium]|nr:tagaturonate reductase [Defluviitaleaceae bacterium]